MRLAPEFLPIHNFGCRRSGLWSFGLRRNLRSNDRRRRRGQWFWCGRMRVLRGVRRRGRGSGGSGGLDLCLLRWRSRRRRRCTRGWILLCNLDDRSMPVRSLDVNRDRCRGKSGDNRSRNPDQPPLFPPCIGRSSFARRYGSSFVVGIGGFARQRHHLAATCADGKMREHLAALPLAQRLLGKRVQALRIGMKSVLARSQLMTPPVPGNASDCEFCSSFFRFIPSRVDRLPSLLPRRAGSCPLRCRFLRICLRISSAARCSLRLTVASCTPSTRAISSKRLPVKIIRRQKIALLGVARCSRPLQSPAPAAKVRGPASAAQDQAPARQILR